MDRVELVAAHDDVARAGAGGLLDLALELEVAWGAVADEPVDGVCALWGWDGAGQFRVLAIARRMVPNGISGSPYRCCAPPLYCCACMEVMLGNAYVGASASTQVTVVASWT